MKKHARFTSLILALTTLLAAILLLSACDLLTDPFPNETYTDTIICYPDTETGSNIHIAPDGTETTPASDIRTMYGTVVEYEAEEPMDNVVAVRVYRNGKQETMHLLVENASDFCVGDPVIFQYDANLPLESFDGHNLWEAISMEVEYPVAEKPVIYLYPETPTEVSVKLTIDGKLTCTYPAYENGWDNFTAYPDGTLISPEGKEYYCLYWEGIQNMDCDFTRGFCIKGEDTAAFLEWALSAQGLTPREANEFIIYWLPRMEQNPYNVIAFQTDAYTKGAVLEITPNPDSLLRVFMAYYPSDEAVEIEAQTFTPFERVGFTVVEWGGSELKKN